jgi:hypothetical protein
MTRCQATSERAASAPDAAQHTVIDLTEQAGPADDVPPLKSAIASLLALPLSEDTMRAALSDLTRSGD